MVTENQRVSVTEAYSDQSVIEQIRRLKKLKQNKLTAGENITIEGDVISATGGGGVSEWGDITGTLSNQTDLKAALDGKEDVGTAYTKAETDTLLSAKADASNVYTKSQTYDKQEIDFNFNWVDSQLSTKADQLSVDAAIAILNSVKQNKLTAGTGITIVSDVISCSVDLTAYKTWAETKAYIDAKLPTVTKVGYT